MAHSPEDIRAHVKIYLTVFGALMVLTLVTVAIAYLNLPIGQAVALALIVATIKGSLVAMFFMHLKGEKPIIVWTLALTMSFLVVLFGLPLWTDSDRIVDTRPTIWAAEADKAHAPADHASEADH